VGWLEEELRNLAERPPPYMNQREINAEKEPAILHFP
jgi:hypothetical protein